MSSSSASSTRIQQMRQTLAMLDNHELPEKFQPSNSNSKQQERPWSVDASLMKRYQGLRETYIRQTIQNSTLNEIPTFDGSTFPKSNNDKQEEEQAKQLEELKLRKEKLAADVIAAAQQVHANVVHVQSEYAVLQQRKEELRRMVDELEEAEAAAANADGDDAEDGNDNETDDDEDDVVTVTEEDFATGEALAELQRQKAVLQDKLRALQSEQTEMEHDTQSMLQSEPLRDLFMEEKLAQAVRNNNNNGSNKDDNLEVYEQLITKLHKENEAMSSQVEEHKAMTSHFDSLRLVMEELGGIRILSVEPKGVATASASDDGNTDMEEEEEDHGLTLKVELLGRHEIEVDLQVPPHENKRNRDRLRVQAARFVTSTLLQGPVMPQGDANNGMLLQQQVAIEIPPLDDLVQVAKSMPDAKGLRLVLQEALARIDTMELRLHELSLMQTEAVVLTQVGPTYTTTTTSSSSASGGAATSSSNLHHQQQDVACRLVDYGLMAVLRLAPDCPRRPGSVVLDQLVLVENSNGSNNGVWKSSMTKDEKEQIVDEIRDNLHERQLAKFKSPVQVVQAIKERVAMAMTAPRKSTRSESNEMYFN